MHGVPVARNGIHISVGNLIWIFRIYHLIAPGAEIISSFINCEQKNISTWYSMWQQTKHFSCIHLSYCIKSVHSFCSNLMSPSIKMTDFIVFPKHDWHCYSDLSIIDVTDSGLTSVLWWVASTSCKLVMLVVCKTMNHFSVLLYAWCDNTSTMPHSAPRKCQCVVSCVNVCKKGVCKSASLTLM
jgi:hypothetical protein